MITPLQIDMNAIPAICSMMHNGIKLDTGRLASIRTELWQKAESINAEIDQLYGSHINPKSPMQVMDAFRDMGIFGGRVKSTDKDTLHEHLGHHPIVKLVIDYREHFDLVTKYCDSLPRQVDSDGRIHTTIKHTRTNTGRYSSADPNLQNQSKRTENGRLIRSAFVAESGCALVAADDSQMELRVNAHIANDQKMIDAFLTGADLHAITASGMFGLPIDILDSKEHRRPAKDVNFGTLYGISAPGLYRRFITAGLTVNGQPKFSEYECGKFIASFFSTYPDTARHISDLYASMRRNGYSETIFSRRRLVPAVWSTVERVRASALREGGNHPVQGSSADLMKMQIAAVWPIVQQFARSGICRILMTIHDEILFEVEQHLVAGFCAVIKPIMENVYQLRVPLRVDVEIGDNWCNMEETT